MSPNNKPNLANSELEEEIQDTNFNQFIHQFVGSDEEDDHILNNGYVLLNQDLDQQNHTIDDESESDFSESSDDEDATAERRDEQHNSNYHRWNVNIEWADDGQTNESNDKPNDATSSTDKSVSAIVNEDAADDDDKQSDSRFKSYLTNQLNPEEAPFQREFDKTELASQLNPIRLDKGRFQLIFCSYD